MIHNAKSIRAFIGAINFDESRFFYKDFGFEEVTLSKDMSLFKITPQLGFYLQNAYVKDWVDNTMMFLEVDNVTDYWNELQTLGLEQKYKTVKLKPIVVLDWGKEFFVHDPAGVLWHIGEFK
jgi:hypothetical protein